VQVSGPIVVVKKPEVQSFRDAVKEQDLVPSVELGAVRRGPGNEHVIRSRRDQVNLSSLV
jgi:hypothetical protein